MMKTTLLIVWSMAAVFCIPSALRAEDAGPLLHWKLDEGRGTTAHDSSGHGLDGTVGGGWETTEAGSAPVFDGTPTTVVRAELPPAIRLGKGSWTVMAWVNPKQFSIDDAQNQRRLFSYGTFPRANFCVDLLNSGNVSLYQIYQADGKNIDCGGGSSTPLALGRWAHVAVVCDRKAGRTRIYINGRLRGEQEMPPGFTPDMSVNGEFTVGAGWHNYMGLAKEVRLYSRALPRQEVRTEFDRLKDVLKVVPTAEESAADAREALQESLAAADRAWAKKDFSAVRAALSAIVSRSDAPAQVRSYAHLRLAQSYAAQGRKAEARAEYARIAAVADYPPVHRSEAAELVREFDRQARGLPARDPSVTRVSLPAVSAVHSRLFVAPKGSDGNPGTVQRPLATLAAARDRVRALHAKPGWGTIEVVLAPGTYRITKALMLTREDSGSAKSPVIYRAQTPGTVVLYGGARLSGFIPVTDPSVLSRLPEESRGKVVYCELTARGIRDYGALAVRGFGQATSPPTLELYVDRQPMTLARWPNKDFVTPTKLVDPGDKKLGKPSVLGYDYERHARWTQAEDPWIFGYFHYLWADATAKIAKIDTAAKTLTTEQAYDYGGGMSTEQGIKYYAFNLLEEIDEPGEWYLNRGNGNLYLYPPADLAKSTVEISMLSTPMISAKDVAHVRFEGLTFDLGRGDGIVLENCTDCAVAGCTVSRMAGNGIRVLGGSRDTLLSCDVHTIGRRATEVIGGDRATLTPGGHVVANCRIHDFGRIDRTYTPGIQLEGVGNHVTHNLFYNCPSSVMRIEGNDHVIEYNEVHHAVRESDDQGAMELFGNPTYRGVVFRYNLYHQIGAGKGERLVNGQAAIRLDDVISGMTIYGNIFYQAANGAFGPIQINSGRDNVIDNNIFADSPLGITGGYAAGNGVWQQVRSGQMPSEFYMGELYMKRYPEMRRMLQEPAFNHAWRNVFYRIGRTDRAYVSGSLDMMANGIFPDQNPGFADAAHGNFRLKPDASLMNSVGFRPIPIDEIGVYPDAWRKR